MTSASESGDVTNLIQDRYGKYVSYAWDENEQAVLRAILGCIKDHLFQMPYLFGVKPDTPEFLSSMELDHSILKPHLDVLLDGPFDAVATVLQNPVPQKHHAQ